MRDDIESVKAAGGHGVVFGVLTKDGMVDEPLLRELVGLSAPLEVTFHRAIDMSNDPIAATRACVRCGVSRASLRQFLSNSPSQDAAAAAAAAAPPTPSSSHLFTPWMDPTLAHRRAGILTSGGAPSAIDGLSMLRSVVDAAGGQLIVAAGGGVSEANAQHIATSSGVDELHGSLRCTRRSQMEFRPTAPIPMGAEKVNGPESEYETKEADVDRVAAVVRALAAVPAPRAHGVPRPRGSCSSRRSLAAARHSVQLAACLVLGFVLGLRVTRH